VSIKAFWVVACDGCGKRPNTIEYHTYDAAVNDVKTRWKRWFVSEPLDNSRFVLCPTCFDAKAMNLIDQGSAL